jgi:hypothetical protein
MGRISSLSATEQIQIQKNLIKERSLVSRIFFARELNDLAAVAALLHKSTVKNAYIGSVRALQRNCHVYGDRRGGRIGNADRSR